MGSRGNRRRARSTVLVIAYALLVVILAGVGVAMLSANHQLLRFAALGAGVGAFAAAMLVRHQLIVERTRHSADRAQLSHHYSRITSDRVIENAEFVDTVQRRLDQIEADVATVLTAHAQSEDLYGAEDAPTVVDLKLRGLAAS